MYFDKVYKQLLNEFNVYPKPNRTITAYGTNTTSGDVNAATFNGAQEVDLNLPTPKELEIKKLKARRERKKKLSRTYLPGENKPRRRRVR